MNSLIWLICQHILRKYYLITFLNLRAFGIKIPTLLTAAVNITLNFRSLNLFARYTLSKDLLLILKVIISWRNLRILFSPLQNLTLKILVLKLFQLIQFYLLLSVYIDSHVITPSLKSWYVINFLLIFFLKLYKGEGA